MKLKIVGNHPGQYKGSSIQIDILSSNGRYVIGQARRTGVTPPGYPDHPVYKFEQWSGQFEKLPEGHFVFDGAKFHESAQWRDKQREEMRGE